ncbi:1-phosphofructokinase family hexose kinase [Dyella sp. GSA-30]|uniref:1-phosphofructokinase family hexose kinase n=1 Tax=Dyella sp. GSA-30 TaxID=2994496 RepID=UPI002492C84E|nr:1-phosphofructokinase family hexose kinase [Dyella sp. GSA-30]BDU20715.1 tagatose-6-phosphate kinase [Dyella sp. GSA-30]
MITVAGFNTAIDRLMRVEQFRAGEVSRALDERVYPGGKGMHVAQTIAALGERVQLVGLVDKAHRNLITQRMAERGVLFHGVEIGEDLRLCIAVQDAAGAVTEVLGRGPLLTERQCEALRSAFWRAVDESELAVLSGSLPRGMLPTTYASLAEGVRHFGKRCLVDASGDALQQAVAAAPYLVKPNRDEAIALLGYAIDGIDSAAQAACDLHARGIAMPVVSMGALGAIAADTEGAWHAELSIEQARNTVGSGDCLLAGLAVGIHRGMPLADALALGVACGAANALNEETGFVERDTVEALLPRVRVRRVTGDKPSVIHQH